MKTNIGSSLLFLLALAGLAVSIVSNPPGDAPWAIFAGDPATLFRKAQFVVETYVWPGVLACFAISMFQLQSRLASSGANKRTVFAACVLASGSMLMTFREISFHPAAGPSYVAGMALGYTIMSRLYAVRMRGFLGRVGVPWPIWRGDAVAMQEVDQAMRARAQRISEAQLVS
jgi:hypothetical protein